MMLEPAQERLPDERLGVVHIGRPAMVYLLIVIGTPTPATSVTVIWNR
jgi:hypothetical protein